MRLSATPTIFWTAHKLTQTAHIKKKPKRKRGVKEYNLDHMEGMIAKGLTPDQVAKYYGRHRTSVVRWMRDAVKRRYPVAVAEVVVVEEDDGLPTDTRSMTDRAWAKEYMSIDIFGYQDTVIVTIRRGLTIVIIARQHGKSTIILLILILRTLCESIYEDYDRPILYMSHSKDNIDAISNSIRNHLLGNPKIIETYGKLIDRTVIDGLSVAKQGLRDVRLTTLKDKSRVSFRASTIQSGLRGGNFADIYIDDPADYKEIKKNPAITAKVTEDLMELINVKIVPLIKGNFVLSGTRYAKNDIYALQRETRAWQVIELPAFIGDVPTYEVPDLEYIRPTDLIIAEGNYKLLAPELWKTNPNSSFYCGTALQNIMFKHNLIGEDNFQQEFMNNPYQRNAVLNWEDIQECSALPTSTMSNIDWIIFVDPASGKTAASDYTSIVLVGLYKHRFYLTDIIFGRWTGKVKQDKLEGFYNYHVKDKRVNSIKLRVEVVRNRDFYNRLVDESTLNPIESTPRERGDKEERIINNFGTEAENRKVYILTTCRSKKRLQVEVEGFPSIHPDVLDGIDQSIHYLRRHNRIRSVFKAV